MTAQANTSFVIQAGYDDLGCPNYMDNKGNLIAGIYADVANEDYHAIPALSSSGLKKFKSSPALYMRTYLSDVVRQKIASRENAFLCGEITHGLVLEPERTNDLYWYELNPFDFPDSLKTVDQIKAAIAAKGATPKGVKKEDLISQLLSIDPQAPVFDVLSERHVKQWVLAKNLPWTSLSVQDVPDALQTEDEIKAMIASKGEVPAIGKAAMIQQLQALDPTIRIYDLLNAEFQANLHKTERYAEFVKAWVCDPIIYKDAHRARNTVMAHKTASRLFAEGIAELTMIAYDDEAKMWVKCKFDWLRPDGIAVDLKTTRSTHPDDWAYQAKDLGYDLQDAFYCHVASLLNVHIKAFPFVCVEFAEMDNCEVYELSAKTRAKSYSDMKAYLLELRECQETGNWYGYNKQQSVVVIDF